jgi:ribonuclease D
LAYVQTDANLAAVARAVRGEPLIAIDTEAAGYHRYHDRVCLLQLSTRTDTHVVDTLAVKKLDPLADVLASDQTEVVIHDAEYDLRLLGRDHGLSVGRLFDTKIAAQFAGEPGIGLANLVEKYLGVKLDKKHQRADWAHRPLTREQLEYAAEDTRHLPALRDRLRERLEELGRLAWAEEEFRLRESVRWGPSPEEDESWQRIKNTRDLTGRQLAALRELCLWREGVAEEKDVAPFRVMGNDSLVAVARAMPESAADLATVPGLAASVQARRGEALLEAVRRAKALPADGLPERRRAPRRPPPEPEFDALVERLKVVRDREADALGLDRGFLMPRQQLEDIARARPRSVEALAATPEMRAWQVAALGEALLDALKE